MDSIGIFWDLCGDDLGRIVNDEDIFLCSYDRASLE